MDGLQGESLHSSTAQLLIRRVRAPLAALVLVLCAHSPVALGAVAISPAPGTPDASPQTQISILGAAPRSIESVLVTGAQTGTHPGRLHPYSGDRGASFVL